MDCSSLQKPVKPFGRFLISGQTTPFRSSVNSQRQDRRYFMDPCFSGEPGPMTQEEKAFFKALGARIAALRKDSDITQVQLAQTLGVSQQTVASWEVGRRGVPVSN